MAHGDCGCEFPRCGNGRCIGSHFCPKHLKMPFRSKAEVNAYRRGQRDGRAEAAARCVAVIDEERVHFTRRRDEALLAAVDGIRLVYPGPPALFTSQAGNDKKGKDT